MHVTHLEMTARPSLVTAPLPDSARVLRALDPTLSFYRYLYDTVGEKWQWQDRRKMSPSDLMKTITDPRVEVWVLYVDGVPAGYGELDRRQLGDVELAYFGLVPEFIGKGLGRPFLDWIVSRAWGEGVTRIWVHTCELDHPRALSLYREVGFTEFDPKETRPED